MSRASPPCRPPERRPRPRAGEQPDAGGTSAIGPRGANRCTLFTAVRNEAPFLVEWIAYHKVIGCDRIVIVSNDCTDGTAELLDALHDAGEVVHVAQTVRPGQGAQEAAARRATERGLLDGAEWAIWLDADEFLNIHVGEGRVADLTAVLGARHGMLIHWRLFGDGGNRTFGGRFVSEDFVEAAPDDDYLHYHVKTLFRVSPGNLWLNRTIHRPGLRARAYSLDDFVTGDGTPLSQVAASHDRIADPMQFWYINQGWLDGRIVHKTRGICKHGTHGHTLAQINHYAVRTPERYALKKRRGNGFVPCGHLTDWNRHEIDYYRRYNGRGIVDRTVLRFEDPVTQEMARLRGIGPVRAAEDAATLRVGRELAAVPPEEIATYVRISEELRGGAPRLGRRSAQKPVLTLRELRDALQAAVLGEGLDAHLKSAWVFRNARVVLEFIDRGAAFGVDVTPTASGLLDLDVVARGAWDRRLTRCSIMPPGVARQRAGTDVPLAEAGPLVRRLVLQFRAEVARVLDGATPEEGAGQARVKPRKAARRS